MSGTDSSRTGTAPTQAFTVDGSVETFRTITATVGALVAECRLDLDADGLRVVAVDPAEVGIVALDVDAAAFDAYEAEDRLLGIDLERLDDVLSAPASGRTVRLSLDPEVLALRIEVEDLAYTMGLLDPDTIRAPMDHSAIDVPSTAEVVLEGSALDRAVRAAAMVGDTVALAVDEAGTFTAEADGDTDDVTVTRPAEALVDVSAGDARSLFSLEYLRRIVRPIPDDAQITLRLGIEAPASLTYEVVGGHGTVEYLLAPRRSR